MDEQLRKRLKKSLDNNEETEIVTVADAVEFGVTSFYIDSKLRTRPIHQNELEKYAVPMDMKGRLIRVWWSDFDESIGTYEMYDDRFDAIEEN